MPLDTSSYSLALLRTDGRRWNELRRLHAQMSTQDAADGSSYLEMGNTKVMCVVSGPEEGTGRSGAGGGGGGARGTGGEARVETVVNIAAFSGVDRKRRGRNDKRTTELSTTISSAFAPLLRTHLPPTSTITISLNILSSDGSLLAACINATTLALISAGIPLLHYLTACTAGSTSSYSSNEEAADPLLDLNGSEEQELPFLTVATVGGSEKVSVLVMETRCQVERVEGMLAVGVDGCRSVLGILDGVVRAHGRGLLGEVP